MTNTDNNNENDDDDIILAAVEGGGTTFVVTIARLLPSSTTTTTSTTSDIVQIGTSKLQILHSKTIPSTTSPTQTLSTCTSFFQSFPHYTYKGVGIATFGPVGLNTLDKETYGTILNSSPKKEWRNVDLVTPILQACSSTNSSDNNNNKKKMPPHKLETDVNAPAWAEYIHRNSFPDDDNKKKKISSVAYITVGTGVGVGLVINHCPVHGLMHPEGGHVTIAPLKDEKNDDEGFEGGYSWGKEKSPYQGVNTVEGVASSIALSERLAHLQQSSQSGKVVNRDALKDLTDDNPIWDHAANALANLCVSLILLTSVEQIVLGGGIMNRTILYDKIRCKTREILNHYLASVEEVSTEEGLQEYITGSCWGERDGLVGALSLALDAYQKEQEE